jgi:hypothetical protein
MSGLGALRKSERMIRDLRDKFRDAFTGWLEIEQAA